MVLEWGPLDFCKLRLGEFARKIVTCSITNLNLCNSRDLLSEIGMNYFSHLMDYVEKKIYGSTFAGFPIIVVFYGLIGLGIPHYGIPNTLFNPVNYSVCYYVDDSDKYSFDTIPNHINPGPWLLMDILHWYYMCTFYF
jgi:hypothetical protein